MLRLSSSLFAVFALALTFVAVKSQQGQAPPPPFLEEAPESTIKEFHDLLSNSGSMTDQQIDDAVNTWVGKQTPAIQKKYATFKDEMQKHQKDADQQHQTAVQNFSPEAKAADEKLAKIAQNPSLTAQEKGKQIEAIVSTLPANVRAEIEKAMQG